MRPPDAICPVESTVIGEGIPWLAGNETRGFRVLQLGLGGRAVGRFFKRERPMEKEWVKKYDSQAGNK